MENKHGQNREALLAWGEHWYWKTDDLRQEEMVRGINNLDNEDVAELYPLFSAIGEAGSDGNPREAVIRFLIQRIKTSANKK